MTLSDNIQGYIRSSRMERALARAAAVHSELADAEAVNNAALGWVSLSISIMLVVSAAVFAFAVQSLGAGVVVRSIALFIAAFFGVLNMLRFAVYGYRLRYLMRHDKAGSAKRRPK